METKRPAVRLPIDLHKAIKIRAIEENTSLNDLIIKVLTEYLAKTPGK